MSLYVTGDVHGDIISRFGFKHNPNLRNLTENDTVVVLGDWAVPWNNTTKDSDKYKVKWLDEKPWTTIALRGNHDNTDLMRQMPQEKRYGGNVRRLQVGDYAADHIFIIDEPTILTIENQKCLCIPGAKSHDIRDCSMGYKGKRVVDLKDPQARALIRYYRRNGYFYRILGQTWWEDEDVDIEKTKLLLENNKEHFDFIFSHDYPGIINEMYRRPGASARFQNTEAQTYLETVRKEVSFDAWLHGHLHADLRQLIPGDDRVMCLYHSLIQVVE